VVRPDHCLFFFLVLSSCFSGRSSPSLRFPPVAIPILARPFFSFAQHIRNVLFEALYRPCCLSICLGIARTFGNWVRVSSVRFLLVVLLIISQIVPGSCLPRESIFFHPCMVAALVLWGVQIFFFPPFAGAPEGFFWLCVSSFPDFLTVLFFFLPRVFYFLDLCRTLCKTRLPRQRLVWFFIFL